MFRGFSVVTSPVTENRGGKVETIGSDEDRGCMAIVEAGERDGLIDFVVKVQGPDPEAGTLVAKEFKFVADPSGAQVQMVEVTQLTGFALCLAGCAGTSAVGALVSCFDKNPKKYLECLRGKGRDLAADVVKCAIGCGVGSGV